MQIKEQLEQVFDAAIAAALADGSLSMEQTPAAALERPRDAANGDWSIRHSSSCRDRGKMLDWMATAADLAGNPRVVTEGKPLAVNPAALPDIGCYENQEETAGSLLLLR